MPVRPARIRIISGSSLRWAIQNDLLVILVVTSSSIPDDVFTQFIKDVREMPWTRCLGATLASLDMTSVQRGQVAKEFKGKRTAAVTDNSVARGVATALGWLGLQIRAWSWDDIQLALVYLELNEDEQKIILGLMDTLRRGG